VYANHDCKTPQKGINAHTYIYVLCGESVTETEKDRWSVCLRERQRERERIEKLRAEVKRERGEGERG